jgi:putative pyruvate formate lyase activating enzyme
MVGENIKLARAGLYFGEEPCISGTNGSGTIFFSGCALKCVMCQNFEISHKGIGQYVSDDKFIEIMADLEQKGAHNINFVTPSHYFNRISGILSNYRPNIPLVYNSSGYDNIENIEKDIFDIYLFDLKYFSMEKSARYSKCEDYFNVASSVIKTAAQITGSPVFDENGLMKRGVIVRHLILPQSTNDSIKIINWLNENTPNIVFSLMSQYVPMYRANEYPEINRKITKREYNKVLEECYSKNFSLIYTQSIKSASTEYIPEFDLTGII